MSYITSIKNILFIFCLLTIVSPTYAKYKKRKKSKKAKTAVIIQDSIKQQTNSSINNAQEENIVLSQLVVSFVSRGYGVDMKAVDDFFYLMNQFNEKNHLTLMYDHKISGREGERDYCFVGNNELLIEQFTKELKAHFANNKLVFVKQYTPCKK